MTRQGNTCLKEVQGDGYTLAEVLVAMLVTMVLVGVLYALYLAVQRWVAPWQQAVALEDDAHVIIQRLAFDLSYAGQLLVEDDGWTLTYPAGRAVHYRFRDSVLTRNDLRMHGTAVSVVQLQLTPSRSQTQYALRRREQVGMPTNRALHVAIRLALQSRAHTLVVTTAVALRRHRPWPLADADSLKSTTDPDQP